MTFIRPLLPAGLLVALLALAGPLGCAGSPSDDPMGAEPGEARPTAGLHVAAVRGAPGEGGPVLARALSEALRAGGRPVNADPKDAAYTIRGEVLLGAVADERRHVRVLWRVINAGGDEVGTAGQENSVPQAVIEGAWDRLAQVIAEAAVPGIDKVVTMALAEKDRPSTTATGGGVTAVPVPSGSATAGTPMVQLGSWQAREAAERGWRDLSAKHGDLLGGLDHRVVAADLAGRGTFHRLRVGPLKDVASAKELCAALANRRVSCMVLTRGG